MKFLIIPLALVAGAGLIGGRAEDKDQVLALRFLDEVHDILREEPSDGRFGLSRLPTVHGRQYFDDRKPREKACVEAWQGLAIGNALALKALGNFDDKGVSQDSRQMSGHYTLNHVPFSVEAGNADAENEWHRHWAPGMATDLYNSRRNIATQEFTYGKHKATVVMRKVFPSSDSCLKCHTDVKKGKPIGILALLRVSKA